MSKETSKQVSKQPKRVPNPTGKGGFQERPEDRSSGHWDSKMTFSYQYKRFMNMTVDELKEYAKQKDTDRTVVEDLAYKRVVSAQSSLKDVKEITDRTEGKAQQYVDVTTNGESVVALVEFIDVADSQS